MKRYLLPALVAGFGAGVLSIVPVVNSFTCCLFVPLAAYFALFLDLRAAGNFREPIEVEHAILIGVFTGLFAALFSTLFDVTITMITRSNPIIDEFIGMQNLINSIPFISLEDKKISINLIAGMINDLETTGFSFLYTTSKLFTNLIVYTIFGLAGGLIGRQLINKRIDRFNQGQ